MEYPFKPLFKERIEKLLKDKEDIKAFWQYSEMPLPKSIRCNTLKISPEELKKGWKKKVGK